LLPAARFNGNSKRGGSGANILHLQKAFKVIVEHSGIDRLSVDDRPKLILIFLVSSFKS
jgi:hypothetical protein